MILDKKSKERKKDCRLVAFLDKKLLKKYSKKIYSNRIIITNERMEHIIITGHIISNKSLARLRRRGSVIYMVE